MSIYKKMPGWQGQVQEAGSKFSVQGSRNTHTRAGMSFRPSNSERRNLLLLKAEDRITYHVLRITESSDWLSRVLLPMFRCLPRYEREASPL